MSWDLTEVLGGKKEIAIEMPTFWRIWVYWVSKCNRRNWDCPALRLLLLLLLKMLKNLWQRFQVLRNEIFLILLTRLSESCHGLKSSTAAWWIILRSYNWHINPALPTKIPLNAFSCRIFNICTNTKQGICVTVAGECLQSFDC